MVMNPYIYRPFYFFLRHKDLCGYRKYCLVFFATDFFYLKTVLVFSIFAKHLFPRDSYMRCLNIRHLNSIYMNSIRAQLFDLEKKELAMDFIIRSTKNETHVLNAVSPAFSSAFSFCRQVIQHAQ